MSSAPTIYVDADACPVKEEVYKVARRTGCPVFVVANTVIRTPPDVTFVMVEAGPDLADDWIAERVQPGDIVITNDIPLADRALKAGGTALGAKGNAFTVDSIGTALAQRAVMEHLRSSAKVAAARGRSACRTARGFCRHWIPRCRRRSGARPPRSTFSAQSARRQRQASQAPS